MNWEADFITEVRHLAKLMRQHCHDVSWRVEQLHAQVEEGKSVDTTITYIELGEARKELHLLMRSIEHLERHCDQVSPDDS